MSDERFFHKSHLPSGPGGSPGALRDSVVLQHALPQCFHSTSKSHGVGVGMRLHHLRQSLKREKTEQKGELQVGRETGKKNKLIDFQ